jgi:hypothetical protein
MTETGEPQIQLESEPSIRIEAVDDTATELKGVRIRWTVDLGEAVPLANLNDYLGSFTRIVELGEWLGLMIALDESGDLAIQEVAASPIVLHRIELGSLSLILHAPKQIAEGVVLILRFIRDSPAEVRGKWATARQSKIRADLLEYFLGEVKGGRLRLTKEQIFQLLMSADYPALAVVGLSGNITGLSTTNLDTGGRRWWF